MADMTPRTDPDDWFPRSHSGNAAERQTSGEDIERALSAAELILAEGQHASRHLQNLRFGAVSLLIVTLLSVGGLSIGFLRYEAAGLLAVAFVVGVPAAIVLLRFSMRPTRAASTIIAAEIAAMIGELLTEVASREQWPRLRIETTRLRLSRFPLVDHRTLDHGVLADVEQLFKSGESA